MWKSSEYQNTFIRNCMRNDFIRALTIKKEYSFVHQIFIKCLQCAWVWLDAEDMTGQNLLEMRFYYRKTYN